MDFVTVPTVCLSLVVRPDESLCGFYAGDICDAWSRAADLSAKVHIQYREKTYQTVLGCSSELYDEIWTAGKVMYKLEQMVAKGGTLIIYGPHIKEISRSWGKQILECGYHVRDYYLNQMDRFRHLPRGVLAHSTHVRGTGRFENGVEWPDVNVVLATSIPPEICQQISLGYKNPDEINLPDYQNREDEGTLFVANAGETLYKLRTGNSYGK
jgi:nickel-dependent lactate racemase